MSKNLVITALVGILVGSTLLWVLTPPKQTVKVLDQQNNPVVGALTGPDIPYTYISVNGVEQFSYNSGFTTSTTTPCSFQSPAATSTLDRFSAYFETGTTTAVGVTFSTGAAQQASTTALSGVLALAANAKGSFTASSSPEANFIIAPSNWIQVNMKGGAGTVSPVGSCTAVMTVI